MCVFVCMSVCVCMFVRVHVGVCVFVCMCMCACMHVLKCLDQKLVGSFFLENRIFFRLLIAKCTGHLEVGQMLKLVRK